MTFTLAHLSDLHMGPMPFFGPRLWSIKRLLGVANWYRGRRTAHLPETLDSVVADMLHRRPDQVAVTGDLVNIGLPVEHERALAWLQRLGAPDYVSVIPGNHDIYTALGADRGAMRWQNYMRSNTAGLKFLSDCDGQSDGFPYLRRFGDIALIGLNSAVPTRPFSAIGRLGGRQLQRLGNLLAVCGRSGLCRIVLIHHPPLPGQAKPMRALREADKLRDCLACHGAELVLHGHNHENMLAWQQAQLFDGKAGSIPIVGVPSASMSRRHHGEALARYNLYAISRKDGQWVIEMSGRGLERPNGRIVELERRTLMPS